MRVMPAAATVLFVLGGARIAGAQVADGAPGEPGTWAGVVAEGAFSTPEGGVHERAGSIAIDGALSPVPWLELGAGVDVRGATLRDDRGQRGVSRAGLGVLRVWLGTGAAGERVGGGARIVGALGSRSIGADDLDGGAPESSLALQLDGAFRALADLELAATLAAGVVDDEVTSPFASAQVDAIVGRHSVRPIAGVIVQVSPGLEWQPRLRLGAEIAVGDVRLTPSLLAAPPTDPEGLDLALAVTAVWLP